VCIGNLKKKSQVEQHDGNFFYKMGKLLRKLMVC